MSHTINAPSTLKSRLAVAVIMSALLILASLVAMSPATASASHRENGSCDQGDFCMGQGYHLTGGLYSNPGHDPNLGDDKFVYYADPRKNQIVERNTRSVFNNGIVDKTGRNDVLVYTVRFYGYGRDVPPFRFTGSTACVRLGDRLDLPSDWAYKISSFRWVTRAECNRHRQL